MRWLKRVKRGLRWLGWKVWPKPDFSQAWDGHVQPSEPWPRPNDIRRHVLPALDEQQMRDAMASRFDDMRCPTIREEQRMRDAMRTHDGVAKDANSYPWQDGYWRRPEDVPPATSSLHALEVSELALRGAVGTLENSGPRTETAIEKEIGGTPGISDEISPTWGAEYLAERKRLKDATAACPRLDRPYEALEIYRARDGRWKWRVRIAGEVTRVSSKSYSRKRDALRGYERAKRAAA